jgi:hypothetical protein
MALEVGCCAQGPRPSSKFVITQKTKTSFGLTVRKISGRQTLRVGLPHLQKTKLSFAARAILLWVLFFYKLLIGFAQSTPCTTRGRGYKDLRLLGLADYELPLSSL